jgi:2',3'-cyclic-nucleotide 2'-phosphodiesterase (5'-nucleotidase family)
MYVCFQQTGSDKKVKSFFSEWKTPNFHILVTGMKIFSTFIFLFLLAACSPFYQARQVSYEGYRISGQRTDSAMHAMLQPYSDSINKSMSAVVVTLANNLEKKQPEGTLGNFMADALLAMAEKVFGEKPDAAFMNNGGIRLPSVSAGPVTRGKIFELFPFDNTLVLVTIKGDVLQQFLDHISSRGGWPVAGMTMKIKNKKAIDVLIAGKKLDPAATYTIALGDYTANGGDDAAMLVGLPQKNRGYLMRDALFDYLKIYQQKGMLLSVQTENRVMYVE